MENLLLTLVLTYSYILNPVKHQSGQSNTDLDTTIILCHNKMLGETKESTSLWCILVLLQNLIKWRL